MKGKKKDQNRGGVQFFSQNILLLKILIYQKSITIQQKGFTIDSEAQSEFLVKHKLLHHFITNECLYHHWVIA